MPPLFLASFSTRSTPVQSAQRSSPLGTSFSSHRRWTLYSPGRNPSATRWSLCGPIRDANGESQRIWGKQWEYIIEGRNLIELRSPFDLDEVKASAFNYKGAQWLAYVRTEDVDAINRRRLLE